MPLPECLSPQRRLQSLFLFHSVASGIFGVTAFVFPWLWTVLFADGSLVSLGLWDSKPKNAALFMIRMYGGKTLLSVPQFF